MLAAALLTAFAALGNAIAGRLAGDRRDERVPLVEVAQQDSDRCLILLFAAILLPLLPAEWYARMSTIQTYERTYPRSDASTAWGWRSIWPCIGSTGGLRIFSAIHVLAVRARPHQCSRFALASTSR
jgi:hypothetical protein